MDTSGAWPQEWTPIRSDVGRILAAVHRQGVWHASLFVESSVHERMVITQAGSGRDLVPREEHRIERVTGASLCAYTRDGIGVAVSDRLDPRELTRELNTPGPSPPARPEQAGPTGSRPASIPTAPPFPAEREALRRALEEIQSANLRLRDVRLELHRYERDVAVAWEGSDLRRKRSEHVFVRAKIRIDDRWGCTDGEAQAGWLGISDGGVPEFESALAAEVIRDALQRSEAPPGKAVGNETLVVAAGWGGALLHESTGHALEADSASGFEPGRTIAPESVTLVDDPAPGYGQGGMLFDDEGTPAVRTVLVEGGTVTARLADRLTAYGLGVPATGNGRRQDYRHVPMTRMTNLLLEGGAGRLPDLVASVDDGILATRLGGGSWDPSTGRFMITLMTGARVRGGRLAEPVRDLVLRGRTSELLSGIVAVGSDFQTDLSRGICRKCGQSMPVGVGMPSIVVEGLEVHST